jgi:hypothetical protein
LGQIILKERKEKRFFFEKKKQKTFIKPGRAGVAATVPEESKVFAPLFSKSGYFLC